MNIKAMEDVAGKKFVVGALTGRIGILAANVVHNVKVNKSIVISRNASIRAYGDNNGSKKYNEAVKFLLDNELLKEDNANNQIIMFKDLTQRGKRFIYGYYEKMDEICQFNMNDAMDATKAINASGVVQTVGIVASITTFIAGAFVKSAINGLLGMFGLALPAPGIGFYCVLAATAFNVVDAIKSWVSSATFNKIMKNAYTAESAFESIYNDAFLDMIFYNAEPVVDFI